MKKIFSLLLIIAALGIYILTLKGEGGNPVPGSIKNNLDQASKSLELSPERGRFALVMSLAQDHSFALSPVLADAVYPDVGYYHSKFYTFFVPGISLMAIPLYIIGFYFHLSQVFTFFLPVIFAVLNAVFIFLIATRIFKMPVWAGLFSALVFCFGSTSWSYAVTLYQHHATTFFLLSSFYSAWKFRTKAQYSRIYALWVWAAYGLALTLDYPNALLLFPVIIYFFLSAFRISKYPKSINVSLRVSVIFTGIIFLILLVLHGYYNYSHFGSPLRVSGSLPGYQRPDELQLLNTPEKVSVLNTIDKQQDVVKFFAEEKFPNGLYILTVSPDRGLLIFSPIFALGFLGMYFYLKKHSGWEISSLTACVAVLFFLYSSWGDPWGGWAFGPRYLIPAMSILSIFVSGFLIETKKSIFKIVAFILFVYSSAVSLLGVLTTNAIPPLVEVSARDLGYNFLRNLQLLLNNKSSSFIYNSYFSGYQLWQYALPIFLTVLILAVIFLFFLPRIKHYDH